MAIYQTAYYQVEPEAVEDCKKAIVEFVEYVKRHEPGTELYLAWQKQEDPTCFVHLFKFSDEAARKKHGSSNEIKKFESVYQPVLVSMGVEFTDHSLVAGKNAGAI